MTWTRKSQQPNVKMWVWKHWVKNIFYVGLRLIQYVPRLFFLKARAEVESADHLYAVEDGVRFDNRIQRATISEPCWALKGSSMSPHRSSSRRLMNIPSESHLQRYGSSRPYAIVVPRVEGILSRMLFIQNVEQWKCEIVNLLISLFVDWSRRQLRKFLILRDFLLFFFLSILSYKIKKYYYYYRASAYYISVWTSRLVQKLQKIKHDYLRAKSACCCVRHRFHRLTN